MNCPNCGYTVKENENFCTSCGTRVRQTSQNNSTVENNINKPNTGYNYHSQFQNVGNITNNYNDELIDAYIGKNADKIKSGKFSWTGFFFRLSYVWYRKMWGFGFLVILMSIGIALISAFLPALYSVSGVSIGVIVGILFNKTYLKKVEKKVEKIVRENPGKTKEELRMICANKGGTTIIPVILVPIVLILLIVLIATPLILNVIDDAKESAAKGEASRIISGVNNWCAIASTKEKLDGTPNPCSDGVTVSEVSSMVDLGNATVLDISYYNGKVTHLTIESNGKIIEYYGGNYEVIK